MAAITEAAIRELAGIRGEDAPITSCYLDVDGRRLARHQDVEHELEGVLRSARARANGHRSVHDDLLRIDGLKFQLDGGVEGARLYDPYQIVEGEQTDPEYRGFLFLPEGGFEELVEAGTLAAQGGWQIQTHAVGDETIDLVVDVYEAVNAQLPLRDLSWNVMHVFLPTEQALARMRDMGIQATVQDHPVLLGHNELRYWGEERAAYAIPNRLLLDSGLHVGGGTDAPVLPADPFISIWWMVTRKKLDGEVLGVEQTITLREALQLYTINNAVTQFAEEVKGSLEVGKLADMVVLSDDPLSVPADALRDVHAEMTFLGGEVVYEGGAAAPAGRRARPRRRNAADAGPLWTAATGWRISPRSAQHSHAGCCPTV